MKLICLAEDYNEVFFFVEVPDDMDVAKEREMFGTVNKHLKYTTTPPVFSDWLKERGAVVVEGPPIFSEDL